MRDRRKTFSVSRVGALVGMEFPCELLVSFLDRSVVGLSVNCSANEERGGEAGLVAAAALAREKIRAYLRVLCSNPGRQEQRWPAPRGGKGLVRRTRLASSRYLSCNERRGWKSRATLLPTSISVISTFLSHLTSTIRPASIKHERHGRRPRYCPRFRLGDAGGEEVGRRREGQGRCWRS
jgi:hypothetical protein